MMLIQILLTMIAFMLITLGWLLGKSSFIVAGVVIIILLAYKIIVKFIGDILQAVFD